MHVTRRTFIMTSAAATGALLSPTRRAKAAPNERIGVAIIGCRNRGHQVAANCIASGQFDIVSLCDCDEAMYARAAEQLKGKVAETPPYVRDFREVLENPAVDAVVNATPDHWHALITAMALDAGKHVYIEKPVSYNLEDGKAMVRVQKRHPELKVLVGTQQRSGSHFHQARDFVRSGGLGKVAFCRAWVTHNRGTIPIVPDSEPPGTLDYDMWVGPAPYRPYNEPRVHYNWHFMRDYGTGEMGNWGAHWLDVILWFLDLDWPSGVSGLGGTFVVHDAKEWPDTQTVLYRYPDLTILWEQRLWTEYPIHGETVGAELGGDKGSLIITRKGWLFYPKDGERVDHAGSEMEVAHALNFAESIRGQAEPVAPLAEGHLTAGLCHLGNIAAMVNRRIAFDAESQTIKDDEQATAMLGRPYRAPWQLPA